MRSEFLTCLAAFAFLLFPAYSADVWDGENPLSDAVFYLDTRQAEKAMEKDLWQKIGADRKKAREQEREAEEPDEGGASDGVDLFSTLETLDPELLVHVTLVSRDPLRLMAEGAIRFHAGKEDAAKKAIDDFFSLFTDDEAGTGKGVAEKSGERSVVLSGGKDGGALSFTVKPETGDRGMYRFLALYNLKKKIELVPPKPSPARVRMVETFRASKPAACLVLNSIRWMPLVGGGASSRDLRRLMTLAEGIGIAVSVSGTEIRLTVHAAFRKPEVAEAYARKAGKITRDISRLVTGPILRNIRSEAEGQTVKLFADVDIGATWTALMNLQSSDSGTDLQSVGPLEADDNDKGDDE